MQTRYDDNTQLWVISLERGEEINTSIEQFCCDQKIAAAEFRAIGAVEQPTLGYYHLDTKEYEWQEYPGIYLCYSMAICPVLSSLRTMNERLCHNCSLV